MPEASTEENRRVEEADDAQEARKRDVRITARHAIVPRALAISGRDSRTSASLDRSLCMELRFAAGCASVVSIPE